MRAFLLAALVTVAAPPDRVAICHRTGNGSFHLIEVAERAVPAHLAHGDGFPGGPIPGYPPPYHFDAVCRIDP